MTYSFVIRELQGAMSALGTFVALWGFKEFAPCLWRMMLGQVTGGNSHCVRHGIMAMVCLATMVFCFARMTALGFFAVGAAVAGTAFIAAMLIMVVTIGISVWAKQKFHTLERLQSFRTPDETAQALARILTMLMIVTLAFTAVGIIRSAFYGD